MSTQYDEIIVGAGIAGIVAGLLHVRQGKKVALVDSAESAGGLMRTYITPEGKHFDYGTHLLSELGIADLDKLLFECVRNDSWHEFDYLKSGHFIHKTLCERSPVVDATILKEADYLRAMVELVEATANPRDGYDTLSQQLTKCFGDTLYQELLKPAVEKLFFASADDLATNSHLLYGLARVQGFSEQTTRILKQLPQLNDVLAFHSHKEGNGAIKRYYPKQGGIGQWVDHLLSQFCEHGGKLYLNCKITGMSVHEQKVTSLHTDAGELYCQKLTWTIAPFMLLQSTNLHALLPEFAANQLNFLDSWLVHLEVDRAPLTSLHYYNNFDPQYAHFRSTLYSNMQGETENGAHRVTVEAFSKHADTTQISATDILQELIDCGVFPQESQLTYHHVDRISRSFPVPTVAFRQQQQVQVNCIRENLKNVSLYGKARGDIFFMNDVILDIYQSLT